MANKELPARISLVILMVAGLFVTARSQEAPRSSEGWKKFSLLPPEAKREEDLRQKLFVETNKFGISRFDEMVCQSVRADSRHAVIISYQLISFTFYHPTTNDFVVSFAEMADVYELLRQRGKISRTDLRTNEIPWNFVRVVDPTRRYLAAELHLLLEISTLENPSTTRYVRRSFRFVDKNGWKDD